VRQIKSFYFLKVLFENLKTVGPFHGGLQTDIMRGEIC
jgi:hypothetical protein